MVMVHVKVAYDIVIYAPPDIRNQWFGKIPPRIENVLRSRQSAHIIREQYFIIRNVENAKFLKAWTELVELCRRGRPWDEENITNVVNKVDRLLDECIEKGANSIINKEFKNTGCKEMISLFPLTINIYPYNMEDKLNNKVMQYFACKIFPNNNKNFYDKLSFSSDVPANKNKISKIIKYLYENYPRPVVDWALRKFSRFRDVFSALYSITGGQNESEDA